MAPRFDMSQDHSKDNNEGFEGLALALPGMNISHYYLHSSEPRAKVKDRENGKHWFEVRDINDLLDAAFASSGTPLNVQKGKVHSLPLGAKDGGGDDDTGDVSVTVFDFYPNNCPLVRDTTGMEAPRKGHEYYVDDSEGNLGQRFIPVRLFFECHEHNKRRKL